MLFPFKINKNFPSTCMEKGLDHSWQNDLHWYKIDDEVYSDSKKMLAYETLVLLLWNSYAGVPGEKSQVTSDKLPDSPFKFPCIQLWMTRRIWHCIKSHLRPYSTHPFIWCCYVISTFRFPWKALGLNNMTFMQITLCKEDYPVKWPSSPGVSCSPVVIRSPDQCPEVTGSIPPWEIFSIIPSPVAKQPSFTLFIHSCCQYHSVLFSYKNSI